MSDEDENVVAINDSDESLNEEIKASSGGDSDCEARRRLEVRLEEQRLKKQIQDYDFDF